MAIKGKSNLQKNWSITPLLGTLRGEINDVGENLDLYLGADLAQEKEN